MSLFYVLAGLNHFRNPAFYTGMMPSWLPKHAFLVAFSGIVEIVLGLLLLHPATRVWAAWGIIALLIAIFPANVQMSINLYPIGGIKFWGSIARLPFQGLFIYWAYTFTR